MTIIAVAKAQIFIGSAFYPTNQATPPVLADYSADTYVPIGNVVTIGDFGDAAEEIKVSTIADERTWKVRGPRDAGDMSLECAFNDADPGQVAIMTALQSPYNASFKIVLNNPGAGGKGTTTYFRGIVTQAQTKMGAANATVMLSVKVGINSAPLAVPAS